MKGETRIRKNGDAIRSPAHTAAQSIAKIVLFRQDIVPSPFVEGLTLVVMNGIWACGGRTEVTVVTGRALCPVTVVTKGRIFDKAGRIQGFWACRPARLTAARLAGRGAAAGSDVMVPAALLLQGGQRFLQLVAIQDIEALALTAHHACRIELA